MHEDNQTCGFGAEVIATVVEAVSTRVICRRVVRPDTFVPCNYANQLEILPSFRRILTVAADMLDLDLHWDEVPEVDGTHFMVEARGSSPADQSVTIVSWRVRPGDEVRSGQTLAELESDKSVYELAAPVDGRVDDLLVAEGTTVRIGAPILRLTTRQSGRTTSHITRAMSAVPRLHRRQQDLMLRSPASGNVRPGSRLPGISAPCCALAPKR